MDEDRRAIRAGMQSVYERRAGCFDAERDKSGLEAAWLARVAALLPAGGAVLDAGCGTGDPVSRYFIERDFVVTGVDYAAPMIALAKARFPEARWITADMRTLGLGARFDGIVSWHAFFHLSPAEQRIALAHFAAHLEPGGPLLLTVGPRAGEAIGSIAGEPVYHASLTRDSYAAKLDALGVEVIDGCIEDPQAGRASVLLAQRRYE